MTAGRCAAWAQTEADSLQSLIDFREGVESDQPIDLCIAEFVRRSGAALVLELQLALTRRVTLHASPTALPSPFG